MRTSIPPLGFFIVPLRKNKPHLVFKAGYWRISLLPMDMKLDTGYWRKAREWTSLRNWQMDIGSPKDSGKASLPTATHALLTDPLMQNLLSPELAEHVKQVEQLVLSPSRMPIYAALVIPELHDVLRMRYKELQQ